MYQYQNTNNYLAQVPEDLKEYAKDELISLGVKEIKETYRGIYFKADKPLLYKINFKSRLIVRILAPLITFSCHSDRYLYKTAYNNIKWDDFLSENSNFFIISNVSNSNIKHSRFAAQRLKDAIVDYFKKKYGKRPSVDKKNPDIYINLFIRNNKATISLDTSGGSLHKRGYRKQSIEAPMSEIVAAALIKISEWNLETPLYDPFCGSGTILCEAYMYASNTPSGILRKKFGFENLPDFDLSIWKEEKRKALEEIKEIPKGLISGSDISEFAVKASLKNCSIIDKVGKISIKKEDFRKVKLRDNSIIITNPPYGIRLKTDEPIKSLYKDFGDFLKREIKGSSAFIYFGNRELIKSIGLKPEFKKIIYNGGLEGRFVRYDIY